MPDFWKDKKILVYIALAHHTRFITPVTDQLSKDGAQIRYVVGQAERSQEITAINLGIDYTHIFDFVSHKDTVDIQKNYFRLREAFSGCLKSSYLFSETPVTVIDKTIYATSMEYIGFRNLIQNENPDLCIALHELNRWGKIFAFWAKKEGVPFITMQEGLGYNLNFGYTGQVQYSTLNLVWGERIKKKLVSYEAPEDRIIPVGNTHLANEIKHQAANQIRDSKRKVYEMDKDFITLLILSAQLPSPNMLMPLYKFASSTQGQKLIVKFHPATKQELIEHWTQSIPNKFKKNLLFIHLQEDIYDLLSMSDLCVLGKQSTTGIEALAFGKPLVKLDFAYAPNSAYSFVDQGVAAKMSPQELAEALTNDLDFASLIDKDKLSQYFTRELTDTEHSIEKVCGILKEAVRATAPPPVVKAAAGRSASKQFTIILAVSSNPKAFLSQLENISIQSGGKSFETILIEPEKRGDEINQILESLKGDVTRVSLSDHGTIVNMMNKAAHMASGETLVFLDKNLAPACKWLDIIHDALKEYDDKKIIGARIVDLNNSIVHAGMVVDKNNSPIPAYRYLDINFEPALKQRSFQMVDHFMAIPKKFFLELGGFSPDAGTKSFLDICLTAIQYNSNPEIVMYLPDLLMILLAKEKTNMLPGESVYFYSKWHGDLWESQSALYSEDKINNKDIDTARMGSALKML